MLYTTYDLNHKNDNSEPNFLGVKKTFGTDIASIFFSYFPHKWRTQIKIDRVLSFLIQILNLVKPRFLIDQQLVVLVVM